MTTAVISIARACFLCSCIMLLADTAIAQTAPLPSGGLKKKSAPPGVTAQTSYIQEVFARLLDTKVSVPRDFLDKNIHASTVSIEHNPKDASAYMVRGLAYWRMEDAAQASANLEKAFELAPASAKPGLLRILAECLAEQDKNDKAIMVLTRAINMGNATDILYLRRAQAYSQAKNYSAALRDAEKVVELNPHERWALEMRAHISMSAGKYAEAVRDYTACIKMSPQEGRLYADRSRAYDALGKKSEALADRKKRDSLNFNLVD